MNNLPLQILQYAASNFDGDGCVNVGSNECLTVTVDKAQKGSSALQFYVDTFGGAIYLAGLETDRRQRKYQWKLHGPDAYEFIHAIKEHSRIKKQQLEVASTFPMQLKVEVLAEKEGHEPVTYKSMAACAESLGVSYSTIVRRLTPLKPGSRRRKPQDIDGWHLTKIERDSVTVSRQRAEIDAELRRLKHEPHAAINEQLSFAYCAGLFDSEVILVNSKHRFFLNQ